MSVPGMNTVLPTAGASTTAGATASIPLPPVKPTMPPSQPIKPQVNHMPCAPSPGLVQGNATKTQDKPKEAPLKPTANGVDEPLVNNPILANVPVPTTTDPPPPAAIPTPVPAPVPVSASVPTPTTEVSAAVPAAVTVPVPAVVPQHPEPVEDPPRETDAVPLPLPEPEPDAAASPLEPSKSKAAKRRREPRAPTPPTEDGTPEKKLRRTRAPVSPYQCPLPEIATVINRSLKIKDNSQKPNDEKLIVFYKNEFLAVRNADGGFYLCQTMQNIYRSSHKIRIRWLSPFEADGTNSGGLYTRDFYDKTDFECILTTVALKKQERDQYKMPPAELERVESILQRALDVEKGSEKPAVTEEHPDGLDLSLYRDESQLKKSKTVNRRHAPPRKASSPKRAKKSKKTSVRVSNLNQPSTSYRTKPTTRKPPTKRTSPSTPPAHIEKSRAERSLAREKVVASTSKAIHDKPPAKTIAKSKARSKARGRKKTTPKVQKTSETVKADKKQDKKKGKGGGAVSPVASTSKKTVAADKRKSNAHRPVRKRK